MDMRTLRYTVEHRFLPSELFETPAQMIGALHRKKEELIWKMYEIAAKTEQMENPYQVEDFKIEFYRLTDQWLMIEIIMPEPDSEPLCSKVYILFQEEFSNPQYFTVEKGQQGEWFLCSWNKGGDHLNYGKVSADENEHVVKIKEYLKS